MPVDSVRPIELLQDGFLQNDLQVITVINSLLKDLPSPTYSTISFDTKAKRVRDWAKMELWLGLYLQASKDRLKNPYPRRNLSKK